MCYNPSTPSLFPSVAAIVSLAAVAALVAAAVWWPVPLVGHLHCAGRLCPAQGWHQPASSFKDFLIMETYGAPHVMQEELKDFEHDWESHLLLREADAKGAAATPMAAPAGCLDAVPDVPAVREEDERFLLPDTTWPFTGPRWSDTDNAVSNMANKLFNDYTYGVFQPFCSGAIEYDSDFDPSPLCSLQPGARALHTGDSRPLEAGSGNLPPPVAGAAGAGHACDPRGSAFAGFPHILHRGPSPVSDRASPDALQHRRTPKLGSRDKRPLRERQASEGVPPGPLPGARAGPSDLAPGDRRPSSDASDASGSYSGEGSECGDWRDDPELRGLSASEDGSECDGWRRELGAGEVCENYMDAKFGGEEADMAESRM